ncbi:hypothetical protein ACHAWO_002526 [Cyclotella atomus]|uniref:Uncharacterized protein n=1 Tax=Cyclotella atomus TaxID=382360 RepID=A0ABD3N8X8_9STRA
MAPPFSDNSGGSGTAHSIYRFPMTSTNPPAVASAKFSEEQKNMNNTNTSKPIITTPPPQTAIASPKRYICSPLTTQAASSFLHRRLILPTLTIPASLLLLPPVIISCLSTLAYLATGSSSGPPSLSFILTVSSIIIGSTFSLVYIGNNAIRTHAPSAKEMERAYAKCRYALPFWSLILSIVVVRVVYALVYSTNENNRGWIHWVFGLFTTWSYSLSIVQNCIRPTYAWGLLSITIVCRYIGPLAPYMRCSCVPLRINPFDATIGRIGRNCTSKEKFLDMIANGIDVLAMPSAVVVGQNSKPAAASGGGQMAWNASLTAQTVNTNDSQSNAAPLASFSTNARYSRPSMMAIIIQTFLLHAPIGHLFGHTIVLPLLEDMGMIHSDGNATAVMIIWLSCILGSVFELLSSLHEAELSYPSEMKLNLNQAMGNIKRLGLVMIGASTVSVIVAQMLVLYRGHVNIHGQDVPVSSSSMPAIVYSTLLSFICTGVMVGIMMIQDEFTRWAICAPGINPDLIVDKIVKSQDGKHLFLSEDLYVQSVLMGDGATAEKVLRPHVDRSKPPMEEERNEQACASFAQWIKHSSTNHSGKISDDILRMCLLQSIGGGSSIQDKTILKRLHLSAAFSAPRAQPIIVPLARSFLAFAGGLGQSMTDCFRQERKDGRITVRNKNSESWILPSGCLTASQYAILGAAKLIVTNSTIEERYRTKHLSLLMPCVLQSAYKLRCGIFEHALFEANAAGANLSTPDGNGLYEFIEAKHPQLKPVIAACDNAAKMVIKCLHDSGDEKILLRSNWKGEMRSWIVDLNSQITGA